MSLPLSEQLALLADAEALTATIDAAGAAAGWWQAGRAWQRITGRVDRKRQPTITLVFESPSSPANPELRQAQLLCLVEVFDQRQASASKEHRWVQQSPLGWLRLSCFPADPLLPTLANVMQENADAWVVRYRPGRRCTLRVGQPSQPEQIRFAKVFPDQRGAMIHRDGQRLWAAAADGGGGELDFRVAAPGHWDAERLTLWQGCVPGTPVLSALYGPTGERLAVRMGQAAASLACSSLVADAVFDGRSQLQRSARYAKRLAAMAPTLAGRLTQLMTSLECVHADFGGERLRPIHGALHAQQWLDDGEHLGLVDFDRFCRGDPELDAATMVAELDYEDPERVPVAALTEAFLEAYQVRAGPLNKRLFQAYRAHKHLSKALKAARAVRPDGLAQAERNLQRAINHVTTRWK